MESLAGLLISLGAPMLAKAIGNKFGPGASVIAEGALKSLSLAFNTKPAPIDVEKAIRAEPEAKTIIARQERDFVAEMQIIGADLKDYRQLLKEDRQGGLLSRLWRPVFAYVYTLCFFLLIWTVVSSVWVNNVTGLNALIDLAGLLIFMFSTGAAILGVYVWGRTQEKKAGVV